MATLSGSYKVASNASIRAHCATDDEVLLRGLQSTALPVGFTMSTVTASSMGERIDKVLPVGGTYEEISVNYNFVIGDVSQTYLMKSSLNNVEIQDMRFYVDDNPLCGDFAALDLIADAGGAYRVGTFSSPQGTKNELFTGTVSFLPAGPSTLFIHHAHGTDLSFTAGGVGTEATIASTTQDFVALGFTVGHTILLDWVDALDPLYATIKSVGANLITLEDGIGDEDSVPTTTGTAKTAIHSGENMAADGYAELAC